MGHYYENLIEFVLIEVRGYAEEIKIARQAGNSDLVPAIVKQMQNRVKEVLGR